MTVSNDGGSGGPAAPGAAASGTGTAATAPAWHAELPPESINYLQNKGWLDASPKDAVGKILEGYQRLESLRGVPLEQILRKPAPGDAAGQRAFYEQLGAPKEAKGYSFDYAGHDEGGGELVTGAIAQAAYDLGLPKEAAEQFFARTLEALAGDAAREAAVGEAAYASEMASLRANWGANFDSNMFIARQAAQAFGVSEEAVDAMQATLGAKAVMEFFREVGIRIGEDKFVAGAMGGGATMTREGAIARRAELMKDAAWIKRFTAGGAAEKAEFKTITRLIAGA